MTKEGVQSRRTSACSQSDGRLIAYTDGPCHPWHGRRFDTGGEAGNLLVLPTPPCLEAPAQGEPLRISG